MRESEKSKRINNIGKEKIRPIEKTKVEIPEYLKPYLTLEQLAGKHAVFIKQIEKAKEAVLKKDPLLQETIYNEEKKDIRAKNFEQIWQKRWDPQGGKEGYFQSEKKESPFEQYSSKGWKIHIAFERGKEKRKKLGPKEYKYSEYGLPSWSGLGGIPILSKYSKEESETTNTKRWNKASEAERRKYLERMKAIYEESKKELIKDFGAEFLLGKQK